MLILVQVKIYPYIWASVFIILLGTTIVLITKNNVLKLGSIYFISSIIAFGIAESFFAGIIPGIERASTSTIRNVIYGLPIQGDSLLGYSAPKNSQFNVQRYYNDDLLYETIQTFDEFGWRIPSSKGPDSVSSVLFFGCSYTFGVGVNDSHNSSYQLQSATNNAFIGLNFAFEGYGPHQALAIIENKLENDAIRQNIPTKAVLQIIPDHVFRITGKSGWDFWGPEYKINKQGKVYYNGSFNNTIFGKLKSILFKSHLIKSVYLVNRSYKEDDIKLLTDIVKEISNNLLKRYGIELIVILWQQKEIEEKLYHNIYDEFHAQEIPIIEIKEILPNYFPNSPQYIIQNDFHPNEKAHKIIAQYIADILDD